MNQTQPNVYNTLVLVTDQFTCERIIKAARVIADLSKTDLTVLSVMKTGAQINPRRSNTSSASPRNMAPK